MSLNCQEIDLILRELNLPGAVIEKAWQSHLWELCFRCHRKRENFAFRVVLTSGRMRIHRITKIFPPAQPPSRFIDFFHSKLSGAQILSAHQIGASRTVKLVLKSEERLSVLWIRLWTGAANLICTDEKGIIQEALYRRPSRCEIKGQQFRTPSPECDDTYRIRSWTGGTDFNDYIETFYGDLEKEIVKKSQHQQKVSDAKARCESLQRALTKNKARLKESATFDRWKRFGQEILNHLTEIPEEAAHLRTSGEKIPLNPRYSPVVNSQEYFARYKRAKRRFSALQLANEELQKRLGQEKQKLKSIIEFPEFSDTSPQEKVYPRSIFPNKKKKKPPGVHARQGVFHFFWGRNAQENDRILRYYARGNDFWFHARNYPGGYVFLRAPKGSSVPLSSLLEGAKLALIQSKGCKERGGEVYYTQVKYLRRIPGEGVGLVRPMRAKTLSVEVDRGVLNRLLNSERQGSDSSFSL